MDAVLKLLICMLAVSTSAQGTEYQEFKDFLSTQAKVVREKIQTSQKDLESRYKNTLLTDPNYEKRIHAAVYLGILNKKKNPELSLEYMAAAKDMANPFAESEYQGLIEVYHAQSAIEHELNSKATINILENLLSESKRLPWKMKKGAHETVLEHYLSINDTKQFLNAFANYYSALPNFLLDVDILKIAAKKMKNHDSIRNPSYHKVLEIIGSWYPLNEDAQWALKELEKDSEEGRYHFKLSYLRKLYMNGSIESQSQDLIRNLFRQPLRPKKRMSPKTLSSSELMKFFVRIREYDEAMTVALDSLSSESLHERWLASQWIAFINGRLGKHDEAIAIYEDSILDNIEQSIFFQESYAENLMKNKRHARAATMYLNAYKGKRHPRLRWYAFWNAYKAEMDADALRIMSQKERIFTRSRYNEHAEDYWVGKIQMRQGDQSSAVKSFAKILEDNKYDYYSTLIKLQYKHAGGSSKSALLSDRDDETFFSREPDSLNLVALDWGVAVEDIQEEKGDLSAPPQMASMALPFSMSVSSISPVNKETERLKGIYPRVLPEKVDFIANSFELDPYILYALMRAESSFNPVAVSQVGARGIMQMMPYTAVRLSKLLGDESFSLDELNDPNHAIYYGSAYFKLLLEAFDQNLVAAIAAYNAGPKAVNSWLRSCTTHCNIDDFVELIPFKETRLYVKKVLRNYAAYKDLYEQEEVFQELPRVPKESRPDFTVF